MSTKNRKYSQVWYDWLHNETAVVKLQNIDSHIDVNVLITRMLVLLRRNEWSGYSEQNACFRAGLKNQLFYMTKGFKKHNFTRDYYSEETHNPFFEKTFDFKPDFSPPAMVNMTLAHGENNFLSF